MKPVRRMPLPLALLDFTVRLAAALISLPVVMFLYALHERARALRAQRARGR